MSTSTPFAAGFGEIYMDLHQSTCHICQATAAGGNLIENNEMDEQAHTLSWVPSEAAASREGIRRSMPSSPSDVLSLMCALDLMAAMSLRRSPAETNGAWTCCII
jgi:hypothetical protein